MRLIRVYYIIIACCILADSMTYASAGDPVVSQAKDDFQSRKTYAEGIGIGAAAGAAAGALIGGFSNGRKFDSGGAAIGAGSGAALGAVAGNEYANKKVQERRDYQKAETGLENAIAQAKSTKSAAVKFNAILASEVHKMKAGDADLRGTIHDAEKVLGAIQKEVVNQKKTLDEAREKGMSLTARRELQREVNGLEGEQSELQASINGLDKKANTAIVNR